MLKRSITLLVEHDAAFIVVLAARVVVAVIGEVVGVLVGVFVGVMIDAVAYPVDMLWELLPDLGLGM